MKYNELPLIYFPAIVLTPGRIVPCAGSSTRPVDKAKVRQKKTTTGVSPHSVINEALRLSELISLTRF